MADVCGFFPGQEKQTTSFLRPLVYHSFHSSEKTEPKTKQTKKKQEKGIS